MDTWREIEGEDAVEAALAARSSASAGESSPSSEGAASGKPFLMVALPGMPVGASAEVELVCATRRAAECLGGVRSGPVSERTLEDDEASNDAADDDDYDDGGDAMWDAGYGVPSSSAASSSSSPSAAAAVRIRSDIAFVGDGCAATAFVAASSSCASSSSPCATVQPPDVESVLDCMLSSALKSLCTHAGLDGSNVLHVRVYFVPSSDGDDARDDGSALRCSLHAALGSRFGRGGRRRPACTVVPVSGLRLCCSGGSGDDDKEGVSGGGGGGEDWMAMQVLTFDPVRTETEMWIRHGRSYG